MAGISRLQFAPLGASCQESICHMKPYPESSRLLTLPAGSLSQCHRADTVSSLLFVASQGYRAILCACQSFGNRVEAATVSKHKHQGLLSTTLDTVRDQTSQSLLCQWNKSIAPSQQEHSAGCIFLLLPPCCPVLWLVVSLFI